jgi:SAM-dependent methyltransferase
MSVPGVLADGAKALVPRRLKEYLDASAHQRATLATFLDYLETDEQFARFLEERARERWQSAPPDTELTWGRRPSGWPFVRKAQSYRPITKEVRVLEVGPGYGRLVQSAVEHELPFQSWTGVDISEQNVHYLSGKFAADRFRWLHGNIETIALEGQFDLCVSSLTLQHIFPTLERAARNIAPHLADGGCLFFDCREGPHGFFENDGVTWIRQYTRDELPAMLEQSGYTNVRFDAVRHALGYSRLCVIATRSGGPG